MMNRMNTRAPLALVAASLGALLTGCTEISDEDITLISVAEVRQLQITAEKEPKAVLLIDPRSEAAYKHAHLPGAMNLELRPQMRDQGIDPRLANYKAIVVYGDNPGSSAARGMTKRLMFVGYDDVKLFAGGLEEWKGLQYPIEGEESK